MTRFSGRKHGKQYSSLFSQPRLAPRQLPDPVAAEQRIQERLAHLNLA